MMGWRAPPSTEIIQHQMSHGFRKKMIVILVNRWLVVVDLLYVITKL